MNILPLLNKVSDTRQQSKVKYELRFIILFSILAIISDANTIRKMTTYIKSNLALFKKVFHLKWDRSPGHSGLNKILKGIDIQMLENAFRESVSIPKDLIIHIDGKALRGSAFKDIPFVQVLSAYGNNVVIAHEFIEENKTNEIPKAQKMIKELNLENVVYTFDAMHTQRETLKDIKRSRCNVILQVKGNQKTLLKACINRAAINTCKDKNIVEGISHGRNESREVFVFNSFCSFDKRIKKDWKGIKQIIKVKRIRDNSVEESFYISTMRKEAKYYQKVIRSHWEIENKEHYVRDVSLKEDASRIHIQPQIYAQLRSFAFNILQKIRPKNVSITDFMYDLIFNPSTLIHAMT